MEFNEIKMKIGVMESNMEMKNEEFNVGKERDFPPWPISTLLAWLIGALIFSFFLPKPLIYAVSYMDIKYRLGLNSGEQFFYTIMLVYIIYAGSIYAFIIFQLRRTSYSLENIWLSFNFNPKYIAISLLLGMILLALQMLVHKNLTGLFMEPPTYTLHLDWYLALGIELIVMACIIGLVEEVLFRGILYQALHKQFSTVKSTVLSALIFMLHHVDHILTFNFPLLAQFFLFGIIAAILFECTRSLNVCICFHFSYNAIGRVVYYLAHIIPAQ